MTTSGNHYFVDTTSGTAIIRANGTSGTFEQGLPLSLSSGTLQVEAHWSRRAAGGPLQPVTLVAERLDANNFLRAELLENDDHSLDLNLIQTRGGVNTYLATRHFVGFYNPDDWWVLEFQFDGASMKARAWRPGEDPTSGPWLEATAPQPPGAGGVAVRSANSASSVRPDVYFRNFHAQTLGLSIHLMVWLDATQPDNNEDPPNQQVEIFGKGNRNGWNGPTGGQEYELRWDSWVSDGTRHRALKWYVFGYGGGYGAGVAIGQNDLGRWYDLVMVLDPGNFRNPKAGMHLFVDGQELDGAPSPGACYKSGDPTPGDPIHWEIVPANSSAPLRFGTYKGSSYFRGLLDEVAIFPRKLTPVEIRNIYERTL